MKQVALGARPSFICLSRASKRSCCSSYHIFTIILTKTKGSYLHKLHNHFVNINFEHTFKTFKLCFNQKLLHIFNWVIHVLRYIQLFLSLIPKNNSPAPLEDHGISFSLFFIIAECYHVTATASSLGFQMLKLLLPHYTPRAVGSFIFALFQSS